MYELQRQIVKPVDMYLGQKGRIVKCNFEHNLGQLVMRAGDTLVRLDGSESWNVYSANNAEIEPVNEDVFLG
jgi:hypothetical protein